MVSAFLYSETFGMAVEGLQHERCPSGITLKKKLIKTGARIVRHARYVTFQMAEVAVPRALFEQILARIARLTTLCDTG